MFGLGRFLAGVGIGALLATTAALVAEYALPERRNLLDGVTHSGIAVGSTLSALLAILLLKAIGWRGMFLIGALPLVTLRRWPWRSCPKRRCGCRPAAATTKPGP